MKPVVWWLSLKGCAARRQYCNPTAHNGFEKVLRQQKEPEFPEKVMKPWSFQLAAVDTWRNTKSMPSALELQRICRRASTMKCVETLIFLFWFDVALQVMIPWNLRLVSTWRDFPDTLANPVHKAKRRPSEIQKCAQVAAQMIPWVSNVRRGGPSGQRILKAGFPSLWAKENFTEQFT